MPAVNVLQCVCQCVMQCVLCACFDGVLSCCVFRRVLLVPLPRCALRQRVLQRVLQRALQRISKVPCLCVAGCGAGRVTVRVCVCVCVCERECVLHYVRRAGPYVLL